MVKRADLLLISALCCSAPAFASGGKVDIDMAAAPVAEAVRELGRQARVSIAYRDPRIARMKLRAVRGRYTVEEALDRMLAGKNARARRVAPSSYLIEPLPERRPARPRPVSHAPAPAPSPEIVVTATKRDVPLDFYPGSAQVVDGDRLTFADGRFGTDAIATRVASVTSTHLGPGRNKLFIRGIADSSFVGPTQATVGQYWGNSRITYSAPDPSLRLYDVESIEVLEGPQGTLYGAGSLGGVVRVVPKAPDLSNMGGHIWGGAQAVQDGKPGIDGGTIVNIPIVEDRLAFRGLVFGSAEGGYINDRRRGLRDINKVDTFGVRGALRFQPNETLTVDLSALGQRIDGRDSQYADRAEDGLSRSSAIAQPYRNDYWLADLVVRKQWGDIELTTSFGYARQRVSEQYEGLELDDPEHTLLRPSADALPAPFRQANRIEMLMGEMRLARQGPEGTGWLAGVSLLRNTANIRRNMGRFGYDPAALTGVENRADEATLYGEYSIAPAKPVSITLGGRLTHSRISGHSQDVSLATALRHDPLAANTRRETRFLPSIALSYRPGDELTLFARYQEGFRPGGIAVRQDFIQRFDGDRVGTSEVGARYQFGDFKSSVTLSWTDWKNIQADIVDGFGFPTTMNIGDGRVLSLGWTASWQVTANLELEAALYGNDSRVSEPAFSVLPVIETRIIDGSRLPNVADISGRMAFNYIDRLSDRETLDLSGALRFIGESSLGVGPILGRPQGDYVDVSLEARIGNDRRGLSLAITNLTNTRSNRFALGSPFLIRDADHITPLQPRSVRLGFDMSF